MHRLVERARDRAKAPRSWWFPNYPDPEDRRDTKELAASHDAVSKTLWRTLFALIVFVFFCGFVLLGTPDRDLVAESGRIHLPIPLVSDYEMPFSGFLVVGPIVLLSIWIYLQIFIVRWREIRGLRTSLQTPYLFNLPQRSGQLLTALLFYWMTPTVLAVFLWKGLPHPFGDWLLRTFIAIAACSVWLQIRRCPENGGGGTCLAGYYLEFFSWSVDTAQVYSFKVSTNESDQGGPLQPRPYGVVISLSPTFARRSFVELILRGQAFRELTSDPPDLREANLTDCDLSSSNLENAQLLHATLDGINLRDTDLTRVGLSSPRLTGLPEDRAELEGADLRGATLRSVDLMEAKLSWADLSGAHAVGVKLDGAHLRNAKLRRADLTQATLTGAELRAASLSGADLSWADLRRATLLGADLVGANLSHAHLRGVDLLGVDLSEAKLIDADLGEASLSGARGLRQEQIDQALGNS